MTSSGGQEGVPEEETVAVGWRTVWIRMDGVDAAKRLCQKSREEASDSGLI